MKKTIFMGGLLLACILSGCRQSNNEPVVQDEKQAEVQKATDVTVNPKETGNEEMTADDLLQGLIYEAADSSLAEAMGTYVETLSGSLIEGMNQDGEQVKISQQLWACKDGTFQQSITPSADGEWVTMLIYNEKDELLGYECAPCDYDKMTVAKAHANSIGQGKYPVAYSLLSADFQSSQTKNDYIKNCEEFFKEKGSFVAVKTIFYTCMSSLSYVDITAVLEYENGTAALTYEYIPGVERPLFVTMSEVEPPIRYTLHPDKLWFTKTLSRTYVPEESLNRSEWESIPDSAFDLTEAMTVTALKDVFEPYFKIGTGISGGGVNNFAIKSPEFMTVVKKHFSSCTATNLMKPSYLLVQGKSIERAAAGDENPVLSFADIDPLLQWCQENGVALRGHTLVWHNQVPDWFFREGYKTGADFVSREQMQFRLESYIRQYLTYVQDNYPNVVYCWDVVNEAVDPDRGDKNSFFSCRMTQNEGKDDNLWYKVIGEDYVELAFTYARKYAAEDVKLFYNDYSTIGSKKRAKIYALCDYLKSKNLIDGIGLQGYWSLSSPNLGELEAAITEYAKLGLEIQITELSIDAKEVSEAGYLEQANRYASVFWLLRRLDTASGGAADITCVSNFGLMDGYMLSPGDTTNCRFFDKNLQPKPVYDKLMEMMEAS